MNMNIKITHVNDHPTEFKRSNVAISLVHFLNAVADEGYFYDFQACYGEGKSWYIHRENCDGVEDFVRVDMEVSR